MSKTGSRSKTSSSASPFPPGHPGNCALKKTLTAFSTSWTVRSQRSEGRGQKAEVRGQKSEVRSQFQQTRNSQPATRNSQPATHNQIRATFFVLGWIAERLPNLVREIRKRGHEVASHGYYHNLCNHQSYEDLKTDLTDSKKLLEDIISAPVYGYRAPSFAINEDILKVIEDCGYLYDSSYNSFSMHGRYGQLSLSQNGRKGIA
ncbi:MAG: polysaccharide deacetylase family protein, partial [Proteobacteria bacterium]|nr:polysaccharide deacetylase family protein [Pseudomonadota bacterium]